MRPGAWARTRQAFLAPLAPQLSRAGSARGGWGHALLPRPSVVVSLNTRFIDLPVEARSYGNREASPQGGGGVQGHRDYIWRGRIGTQAVLTLDLPGTLTLLLFVFQRLFQNLSVVFLFVFEPITDPSDGFEWELSSPSSVFGQRSATLYFPIIPSPMVGLERPSPRDSVVWGVP